MQKNKTNSVKKICYVILAILIAAIVFFAGFFTNYFTMNAKHRQISWLIDMIDSRYCYYDEQTGEVKKFTVNDYAKAITNGLLDVYSTYYTPNEYSDLISSSKGKAYGVGLSFFTDGSLEIVNVSYNSPAEKAGIKAGGMLKAITYLGERVNFNTFSDFTNLLETIPTSTQFEIHIDYEFEQTFTVTKESFVTAYCRYSDSQTGLIFSSDYGKEPEKKQQDDEKNTSLPSFVAYIKYTSFMLPSTSQLEQSLDFAKSRNRNTVILDLRGNGGGYLSVLSDICEFFINSGKSSSVIAVAVDKNGKKSFYKTSNNKYKDIELIVLADSGSASASECFIGAMLYHGSLTYDKLVITEKKGKATTYGKGIMQTTYPNYVYGDAVKLTTARLYWPDETTCIHGKGISTTEKNSVSSSFGIDAQLLRAIEIAKGN